MTIQPDDIMVIAPRAEQCILVEERFRSLEIKVREYLTIDSSQDKEAPVVFFLTTNAPSRSNTAVPGNIKREYQNVALSRAKDVLIMITNLRPLNDNANTIKKAAKMSGSGNHEQTLRKLLMNYSAMGRTLTWNVRRTVFEREALTGFIGIPAMTPICASHGKSLFTPL
ncbi:hypothetical protein BDW69DRAFT_134145 [Aspergillus filifer]